MITKSVLKRNLSMRKNVFARGCILGILAILFASACEGIPGTITNVPQTITHTFSPTASFTAKSSPIMTEAEDTATPIIGAMRDQCIEMSSAELGQIASIKGLVGYDPKGGTALFWNENASRTYFPVRSGGWIVKTSVSPDHKYALYFDMVNQDREWMLKIIDPSLKIVYSKTFYPSEDLFGWFDSQRLWNYREGNTNSSAQLNLINPFNGSRQELPLNFPSIAIGDRPSRWTDPIVKYDPSLSLVVYPSCDASCPYTQSGTGTSPTVVLFNTGTNEILSGLTALDDYGSTPIWLSDGSRFIMSADIYSRMLKSPEFFSINREGKITQLTHLHNSYEFYELSMEYSISPDDHLLAFWIRIPPYLYDDARLAILNLENGEIMNYCLAGIHSGGNPSIDTYPIPIWSPDGTQLAIQTRDPQTPENSLITLVDLTQNKAVQVNGTDNVDPVGWLSLP